MTFQKKPEYDRKGRASASAGSGATVIRLPTDKERLHLSEVKVGFFKTPPPFCSPLSCVYDQSGLPYTVILWAEVSKIQGCEGASTGSPPCLYDCL